MPSGTAPSRDELTKAWGDSIYRGLPGKARARFSGGRFSAVDNGTAVFVVPNDVHAARCREVKAEVEAALASHFGVAVPLVLAVDSSGPPSAGTPNGSDGEGPPTSAADGRTGGADEPGTDPFAAAEAFEAGDADRAPVASPADRLKQAFPGAEEVSP